MTMPVCSGQDSVWQHAILRDCVWVAGCRADADGMMRALITGSSGQIGTNLALGLLRNGHSVFGVDKRQNPWTNAFPYVIQDLSVPQRDFQGGIGAVTY